MTLVRIKDGTWVHPEHVVSIVAFNERRTKRLFRSDVVEPAYVLISRVADQGGIRIDQEDYGSASDLADSIGRALTGQDDPDPDDGDEADDEGEPVPLRVVA